VNQSETPPDTTGGVSPPQGRDILLEVVGTARKCTGYGMCHLSFLPGGACPPGKQHKFASYFPQGRMELATAVVDGHLPVTEGLVDIVRSCRLCDICDRQCYFLTGLRPLTVMRALSDFVEEHLAAGRPVLAPEPDPLVDELAAVVGEEWVSADQAILAGYARVRAPGTPRTPPRCVAMPATAQQVAAVLKVARAHGVPVRPRGNGTSAGGALTDGVLLDCSRLRELTVDERTFSARIGAGITGLDLQRAAHRHGLRAQTAEPAACVCANILNTNLHSLYSHSYGVGPDNVIDVEFATPDGEVIGLDDPRVARLLTYRPGVTPQENLPGVCTGMTVKLHPVPADEDVLVVPFASHDEAVAAAKDLCARRIGAAVGMVGTWYAASFLSPTHTDALAAEKVLRDTLGIEYVLIVVGDPFALDAVRSRWDVALDAATMRMLTLGLPNLRDDSALEFLEETAGDGPLYREVFRPELRAVLTMALHPSPEALTRSVDEDMKAFFTELYARPEMSDIRWLTTFRTTSARIGRDRAFLSRIVWMPLEPDLISALAEDFSAIGRRHGLHHGFGYLVPIDLGARCVLEFDYYFDHTDPAESAAAVRAQAEADVVQAGYQARRPEIVTGPQLAMQGLSRPESYLYRR